MTTPGAVVLIVEDDEATRRSVSANLAAHGFRVAEAADVRSAMRSLESSPTRPHPARPRPAR